MLEVCVCVYVCVFVCPGRALQMCAVVMCVCVCVCDVCVCVCGCVHCVSAFRCCSMLGLGRVFVCVCVCVVGMAETTVTICLVPQVGHEASSTCV
jgi:hypothetical protein